MATTLSFFPVANGDMTLIQLGDANRSTLLVDCHFREPSSDPDNPIPDVLTPLRDRLPRDEKGRPYVDVFLLSHPDQDHCRGLATHFYLGPPDKYPDDAKPEAKKRILIKEIWSSPIAFRRASATHVLCEDAKAFCTEAKRRVAFNRARSFVGVGPGNQVLILGEDVDGKTDDLGPILVRVDDGFSKIGGVPNPCFSAILLAPLPPPHFEGDSTSKNDSSVVLNMTLASDPAQEQVRRFLTGGDAEVLVWEALWVHNARRAQRLQYDLLLAPHHCSWHSLSHDSWSELRDEAEVSEDARNALSQMRRGGAIVSSSAKILDDDCDPPCYGAKREYEGIAHEASGTFYSTAEDADTETGEPLEFRISGYGLRRLGSSRSSRPKSLLRPAASATALAFPNRPVRPNKTAGFA